MSGSGNDSAKAKLLASLRRDGISDPAVLHAMTSVPRDRFVRDTRRSSAWANHPLPVGHGQTISQPFIVAYMTQELAVQPAMRVLEIGTGSGYQTAILATLGADVFTVERIAELAKWGRANIEAAGYLQVHYRVGDGYRGWPEFAPYDRIILTAAPPRIPDVLVAQLAVGGRLVGPEGERRQRLVAIDKTPTGLDTRALLDVMFVPMV